MGGAIDPTDLSQRLSSLPLGDGGEGEEEEKEEEEEEGVRGGIFGAGSGKHVHVYICRASEICTHYMCAFICT